MADEEEAAPPEGEAPAEEAPAEEAPAEGAGEEAPAEEGAEEAPPPPPPEEPPAEEPPAEPAEQPVVEKIKRIQVRTTPPVGEDADTIYMPCLPQRPATSSRYKPVLYTFRIPNAEDCQNIRNGVTRRVPFYVLLDHCIAVIWSLINKEEAEKPIGIAQLQWALVFFKAIFNRNGEHPKDVQYFIDIIEDRLLEQYAELQDELDIIEDYACTCLPTECFETTIETKDYPFSINYSEMIKYHPEPSPAVQKVASLTEEELAQELENIKQAAGVSSLDKLDCVSKEKAIDFLSAWKRDQVEKIQAEIERLRSIENMLKSVDNTRFTGRIDEKQFELFFQN